MCSDQQLPHARIMVPPLAFPALDFAVTKSETLMGCILAAPCLPIAHNGADGGVSGYSSFFAPVPDSLPAQDDGVCHQRSHRRRWVVVRGREHDHRQRSDSHLQLLRLLRLRVLHSLAQRQASRRQGFRGGGGHRGCARRRLRRSHREQKDARRHGGYAPRRGAK